MRKGRRKSDDEQRGHEEGKEVSIAMVLQPVEAPGHVFGFLLKKVVKTFN